MPVVPEMEFKLKEEKFDLILNTVTDAMDPNPNNIKPEPNDSGLEIKRNIYYNWK